VYPRRVGLVREYMGQYRYGLKRVVWCGPRADWDDYKECFERWDVDVKGADEVGGRGWEVVAVAKRRA
jgi:hypothetical protein